MRENKRIRENEMIGTSTVEEESTYPNESASICLKEEPNFEFVPLNQHIIVNQQGTQNQQLLYQVQKLYDQDQNLVYFIVPTNENHQLPLSILPDQPVTEPSVCHVNNPVDAQARQDPLKQTRSTIEGDQQHKENGGTNAQVNYSNVKTKSSGLKPIVYHCDFPECLEFFHSLYDKKIHLDSHIFPESTEFKCSICNMKFPRAIDRNKHIENHAIAPTYKCKDCQLNFFYFTALQKHLREKKCSIKSPITCYFCKSKLTDFEDLVRHHHMTMKQCVCGVKKCGSQLFELHTATCNVRKSVNSITCERKRMKTDRKLKKVH